MTVQSNINMYYEELVSDLRERKRLELEEEPDLEPYEARARALDNGLMYYADQAYVLAYALTTGVIQWGEPVEWEAIYDMLTSDMEESDDE